MNINTYIPLFFITTFYMFAVVVFSGLINKMYVVYPNVTKCTQYRIANLHQASCSLCIKSTGVGWPTTR